METVRETGLLLCAKCEFSWLILIGGVRRVIIEILRLLANRLAERQDANEGLPHSRTPTTINLKLAYEAAVIEAKQQEATLDDLRSRAINFMSAISIAVSIFIAINRHGPLFRWWLSAAGLLYVLGSFLFVTILGSPADGVG